MKFGVYVGILGEAKQAQQSPYRSRNYKGTVGPWWMYVPF